MRRYLRDPLIRFMDWVTLPVEPLWALLACAFRPDGD